MNWFEKNWGAPVCKAVEKMGTPVGEKCRRCKKKIKAGDQGIYIPASNVWHIDCFVRCVERGPKE